MIGDRPRDGMIGGTCIYCVAGLEHDRHLRDSRARLLESSGGSRKRIPGNPAKGKEKPGSQSGRGPGTAPAATTFDGYAPGAWYRLSMAPNWFLTAPVSGDFA
jgi:hypothetical protein